MIFYLPFLISRKNGSKLANSILSILHHATQNLIKIARFRTINNNTALKKGISLFDIALAPKVSIKKETKTTVHSEKRHGVNGVEL